MRAALLDTNIISFFLRGETAVGAHVASYLAEHGALQFSLITHYEILSGFAFRDARRQIANYVAFSAECRILPLTEQTIQRSAQLYAQTRTAGRPVDDIDLLIAGVAHAHGLALVTRNTRHFAHLPGLDVLSWT